MDECLEMESFVSPSVSDCSLSNCAGKLLTCGITETKNQIIIFVHE